MGDQPKLVFPYALSSEVAWKENGEHSGRLACTVV